MLGAPPLEAVTRVDDHVGLDDVLQEGYCHGQVDHLVTWSFRPQTWDSWAK